MENGVTTSYKKYPRTPYLPWSPSISKGGEVVDIDVFKGKHVVVTEKMDGENTSMYRDHIHARSIDSSNHPSRDWIKAYHANVCSRIPEGQKLIGENMFAKHSIKYTDLVSYFYLFACMDANGRNLSWNSVRRRAILLGCSMPKVFYWGLFEDFNHDDIAIDAETTEGYVIRDSGSFESDKFQQSIAKWVRPNHVQTDSHWMHQKMERNGLRG